MSYRKKVIYSRSSKEYTGDNGNVMHFLISSSPPSLAEFPEYRYYIMLVINSAQLKKRKDILDRCCYGSRSDRIQIFS